jgi:nucleotide-binding universal stress UspA family protein
MILIAYDGSDDARETVDHVGKLVPGSEVTVVNVWEPMIDVMARVGVPWPMAGYGLDVSAVDEASEQRAQELAEEGAARARDAGLTASTLVRRRTLDVGGTLLAAAAELDADAIAIGTRGLTGVRSVLGSVSHSLVQHADRPVMVVPSAAVVTTRHQS